MNILAVLVVTEVSKVGHLSPSSNFKVFHIIYFTKVTLFRILYIFPPLLIPQNIKEADDYIHIF